MKPSMFKNVFLALVLAMFGAMALLATAAECQTQPNGNMVCDGQMFQPVASTSAQDTVAAPSRGSVALSQEGADAISELEEEEKRIRLYGYIMFGVFAIVGLLLAVTGFKGAFETRETDAFVTFLAQLLL